MKAAVLVVVGIFASACAVASAQTAPAGGSPPPANALPSNPSPAASLSISQGSAAVNADPAPQAGPAISLEEAITRARSIDHGYVSAAVDKGTADAQRTIARAAVLPNVDYHNQVLYTQPQRPYGATTTGTTFAANSPAPIFIANNAVREYVSQGIVTETIGYGRVLAVKQAYAQAAAANARLEIARRGLVATVVAAYYGLLAANEKLAVSARALDEANRFLTVSQQLETGGEVAHADVLKARIEQAQKDRDFQDAQLLSLKGRLDLGVLLFPDPAQPYTLAANLRQPPVLPSREELAAGATKSNPDIQAALATLRAAQLGVSAGTAAYLPDLTLAYNYGIDSDHFALRDASGIRNLGYAASATLDIPVFDWFATAARVKQSKLQRNLAQADLTVAQRRLLAAIQEFYSEAEIAGRQIASLERSVDDARQALTLTTDRYRAGEGTVLEVVDAQNTLKNAESARVDGIVRYFTALADLQTLTGRLP